jgi:cytosine/uracil/thiamine/allantoin permease
MELLMGTSDFFLILSLGILVPVAGVLMVGNAVTARNRIKNTRLFYGGLATMLFSPPVCALILSSGAGAI